MKKYMKGFAFGFVFALILSLGLSGYAANLTQKIDVLLNSASVQINGENKMIDNISYNGNLYLRADKLLPLINYKYQIDSSKKVKIDYTFPTITYPDGAIFRGEVVNGQPQGYGLYTNNNGDTYLGFYSENGIIGKYLSISKDGNSIIIDTMSNGKASGKGIFIYNGVLYNTQDGKLVDSNSTSSSNQSSSNIETTNIKYPLYLYSDEKKRIYLGKLVTSETDTDSIYNEYGTYGSKYNSKSIWNDYGTYGSAYSNLSAFNSYATKPPLIIDSNGNIVGRLTVNEYVNGAINPNDIKSLLIKLGQ